jgi:hypothetical protein
MGIPLPIKISEIKAYAEIYDYSMEEFEELLTHIRMMDNVYLEHAAKKREEQSKRKGKK